MKLLRHLPAVHQLKAHAHFSEMITNLQISENVLTEWLKEQTDMMRTKIMNNELTDEELNREKLIDLIFAALDKKVKAVYEDNLRRVINATGVVLHTNLGRARLSEPAALQITKTASNYSTLEYDVKTGKRGSRHDLLVDYLYQVTGSVALMVVYFF